MELAAPQPQLPVAESGSAPATTNVAVTDRATVIVTLQAPAPAQAPLHPAKVDPLAAAALKVTLAPLSKAALQVLPQSIPTGDDVTVPLPVPALLTSSARVVAELSSKVAVTALAPSMVTVQAPVPEHGPLHPTKVDPFAAAAFKVTLVALAKEAEQVAPQLIPAGLDVTEPEPVPARVTVRVS